VFNAHEAGSDCSPGALLGGAGRTAGTPPEAVALTAPEKKAVLS